MFLATFDGLDPGTQAGLKMEHGRRFQSENEAFIGEKQDHLPTSNTLNLPPPLQPPALLLGPPLQPPPPPPRLGRNSRLALFFLGGGFQICLFTVPISISCKHT